MQRDHDKLEGWAITNHMKFTMSKCCIWHLGQGNPGYTHRLGDKKLESNPSKKDVGVLPDGKSNQCALAAQRASRTLGCIRPRTASWAGGRAVSLCSALCGLTSCTGCRCGCYNIRRTEDYERVSKQGLQRWERVWRVRVRLGVRKMFFTRWWSGNGIGSTELQPQASRVQGTFGQCSHT